MSETILEELTEKVQHLEQELLLSRIEAQTQRALQLAVVVRVAAHVLGVSEEDVRERMKADFKHLRVESHVGEQPE